MKKSMEFIEYKILAAETATYNGRGGYEGQRYCLMGLAGEIGELANYVKKKMRGDTTVSNADLLGECGDILWYAAMFTDELQLDKLDGVTLKNLSKRKMSASVVGSKFSRIEVFTFVLINQVGKTVDCFLDLETFAERPVKRDELIGRIGNIIFLVASLARVLDTSLDTIANSNLKKLASRKERDVIKGNGDNR